MSDRNAKDFQRSLTTRAIALDISKASKVSGMLFFFYKFKYYGISGSIFGLILSFFSNRKHRGSGCEGFVRTSIKCGVFQDSIIGLDGLVNSVISNICIHVDETKLHSKGDRASEF